MHEHVIETARLVETGLRNRLGRRFVLQSYEKSEFEVEAGRAEHRAQISMSRVALKAPASVVS
jgi:hypothetical protein